MKKCIVIGGGFAGLSAAVYLSDHNIQVRLLEASPKLGGRAYSISNKKINKVFDNGQHLLMGCYTDTLSFLNKIGTKHLLDIQDSLNVNFVDRSGHIFKLSAIKKFYPFNLLLAILNYKAIPFKSRLKIIDFFLDLLCCYNEDLQNVTVKEWLISKKQDTKSIQAFWDILVIGTLNTSLDKASAEIFAEVLEEIFLNGNTNAKIILPSTGLSNLYVLPSKKYIEKHGGSVSCSEKVLGIKLLNNRVVKIITDKEIYDDFDFVISAIPSNGLIKILPDQSNLPTFEYSPILNIHLWLSKNPFTERFYGFIDSQIHWLFNNGDHISLTISNAEQLIYLTDNEILERLISDLEIFFPIFKSSFLTDSMIIKEKRATFVPDIDTTIKRKELNFTFENLFVAGDWVNTGLPSTIESSVNSGRLAAQKIIDIISK